MSIYIKDIRDEVKNYFDSQLYLKDFYFDNLIRILAKKEVSYPALMVVPEGGRVGRQTITLSFSFIIIDRLTEGEDNWLDVMTTTQKGMYDLIAYLLTIPNYRVLNATDTINLLEVRDTFNDDEVAGWQASIDITVPARIDKCQLPTTNMPGVMLDEDGFPILDENEEPILID